MSPLACARPALLAHLRELPQRLRSAAPPWPKLNPGLEELSHLSIEVHINGERLTVSHHIDSSIVVIECRLGVVPAPHEATVYGRLLDINFHISGSNNCAFALDDETGDVLHTLAVPLRNAPPDMLAVTLLSLAELAPTWRQTILCIVPS